MLKWCLVINLLYSPSTTRPRVFPTSVWMIDEMSSVPYTTCFQAVIQRAMASSYSLKKYFIVIFLRYRSKYRNRRRSSSSSSNNSEKSSTDKTLNNKISSDKSLKDKLASGKASNDNIPSEKTLNEFRHKTPEFVERPLFEAVEVVKEDQEMARPPSPQTVKRYYGRKCQNSDSELSDLELDAVTNG